MKTNLLIIAFSATFIVASTVPASANSAPVVSNVTAGQRNDDSKLVDIYYDLSDADGDHCTIWVVISNNDGQSWDVPALTLTGEVGAGIAPGANKHIIWDAGKDIPGKSGSFKARIYADDGKAGDQMVSVPGGWYPEDGSNWVPVPPYYIDKYEVTNLQYAEFLNDADPYGQHYWPLAAEIVRYGDSGNYFYTVAQGREEYPIRYVTYYDAEAYAQWKSQKTGQNYHLPNKYQWQKAAAWDPVQQTFWTYGFQSNSVDCSWCNYNNCYGGPLPVGSFNGTGGKNNAYSYYGCYDMSGNVWEWTSDTSYSNWWCWNNCHVIPGGGWNQSYFWDAAEASNRREDLGFRLVVDSD